MVNLNVFGSNNLCVLSSIEDLLDFIRIKSLGSINDLWCVYLEEKYNSKGDFFKLLSLVNRCIQLGILVRRVDKYELYLRKWDRVFVGNYYNEELYIELIKLNIVSCETTSKELSELYVNSLLWQCNDKDAVNYYSDSLRARSLWDLLNGFSVGG